MPDICLDPSQHPPGSFWVSSASSLSIYSCFIARFGGVSDGKETHG
jgi:hypothetical protein